MDFFATAAKGTEPALRDELREARLGPARADRGGVHISGDWTKGFRACLESRVALRVLTPLSRFFAPSGDALYEGVAAIDWSPYLTPGHTLSVSSSCKSSALTHTQFIAQKTKDAIVDRLRQQHGARPSVDRVDPDVHVFVHVVKDEATVYLDLAGESLHRRGYRTATREAPLKENLAAAILRMSGWTRDVPLLDPMCGSGTIVIEAALWARNIAPGLLRDRFGFERWACHDETAARTMRQLREEAHGRIRRDSPPLFGGDIDPRAIEASRENARSAGITARFEQRELRDLVPSSPPGFIVTNPPYGVRIGGDEDLPEQLAAALEKARGHHVSILAGSPDIVRAIRRKTESSRTVYNGDIECRLLTYFVR